MKKQILIFLLVFLTLFLFSCNSMTKDDNKDYQTISETEKDKSSQIGTDTKESLTEPIPPETADKPYPAGYSLQYGSLTILAIGEICELEYVTSEHQPECVGVGVNIVNDFEEAFNTKNYEEKRSQRMGFVTEEMREGISGRYDDVILIESSMIGEIPVGATVFAPLFGKSLKNDSSKETASFFEIRPLLLFSERNAESIYGCERILEAAYVIDGKISIPERIKKGSGLPVTEGNLFIYTFERANSNLMKVGRENLLFHDGMTIEDLKNYIRTATNEFWFRSLTENE